MSALLENRPAVSHTARRGCRREIEAIRLRRIWIGGVYLDNVVVAIANAPPFALFGLERQPAPFLRSDLLKSFRRVSFDFRNRKVRLWLRPQAMAPSNGPRQAAAVTNCALRGY